MECSSGLSVGTKTHAQWGANGGKPFQNDRRRLISINRDRFATRAVVDSVSRNVRADFLKNDLFNLLREALGDFQVSQDMA